MDDKPYTINDKRYVVPEGMLKAIQEAWYAPVSRNDDHQRAILEAALRWWSENPIAPTDKQLKEMSQRCQDRVAIDPSIASVSGVCIEWQRIMFLAPKPNPIVAEIRNRLAGRTLTSEDAAELMSLIQMNTRPPAIRR